MDIFEFAKNREKKMEKIYLDLVQKTQNVGLKKIFNMLAEQEAMHFKVIERMEKKNYGKEEESDLINQTKIIMQGIKDRKEIVEGLGSQAEVYSQARQFEKESQEFYQEQADKAENEEMKNIFTIFAKEEEKHFHVMDELVEYVTRPDAWVTDSEFSSLDEF